MRCGLYRLKRDGTAFLQPLDAVVIGLTHKPCRFRNQSLQGTQKKGPLSRPFGKSLERFAQITPLEEEVPPELLELELELELLELELVAFTISPPGQNS
jgi:hypothetical protein